MGSSGLALGHYGNVCPLHAFVLRKNNKFSVFSELCLFFVDRKSMDYENTDYRR